MNLNERASGVLLHISSLPGPHGIGDLGPTSLHFIDWLAGCGQTVWQLLPTTPIGPGDSPYQSVSAKQPICWKRALRKHCVPVR